MEWWSAFSIGLFGSLHCLGMCGPIAMSLPFQAPSRVKTLGNVLLYNLGRVFTYSLLGIIPGIIGYSLYLAGLQKWLSILTGALLIISVAFSVQLDSSRWKIPGLASFFNLIQQRLGYYLQAKSMGAFLMAGLLNGFLPCGLVYLAFAGAFVQTDIWQSIGFMAFFGMGTLPLMLAASLGGNWISHRLRLQLRKGMPLFVFLMGLFFIFRGLNVELPSDLEMWLSRGAAPFCH